MGRTLRVLNTINEVYYAPQIVASEAGFFEDEGLKVEVDLVAIPDLPSLSNGRADFALSGMWQAWLYLERMGMPLAVFAQVSQQVPVMLFGRVPAEEFDWSSLNGGTFLHTSVAACSPWCALQALLHAKDVDPRELRLLIGFPPDEARQVFKAGLGDVVELFGLGAPPFLADPDAHLLVTWGRDIGTIPWSVYYTTRDRLGRLRTEAVAFVRALARAQEWLRKHEADEITAAIAPRFPDVEDTAIRLLVDAYLQQEQWPVAPALEPESVERWRGFLVHSGLLTTGASFEEIVDPEIAAGAVVA